MSFKLLELPYKKNALEPFLSKETLEFHYEKHYKNYVINLNNLIKNTNFENKKLEEIIKKSKNAIFNNSAQIWNHEFYWNCLTPNINSKPSKRILKLIKKQFESFEKFKEKFINKALANFGSGWTWLVKSKNKINIINTKNAENPISLNKNEKALLVVDIWEHSYYIDYRHMRIKYLENFWKIINWDFVEKQEKL